MNKTEQHKKATIEALKKSLGIVSSACESVGIGRTTFYQWVKDDEDFKRAVNDVSEYAVDFVESKLYERIAQGDTTSIIFFLKTKAKDRGYIEKVQQEHSGETNHTLKVEYVKPDESK